MGWLNIVLVLYALLSISGGVEGYIKTQSIPSIAAGVVIGLLVLGSVATSKSNPKAAYGGALVICVLTGGFFVTRYMKSHAMWPAMTMIVASGLVIAALIAGHFLPKASQG